MLVPRPAVVGAALLALALSPLAAPPAAGAPPPPGRTGDISPTPRSVAARGDSVTVTRTVTVVTGSEPDGPALAVAEQALRDAGAEDVRRAETAPAESRGLTVYLGGPGANPASAAALDALGVEGPAGLPAEGYVLAAGTAEPGGGTPGGDGIVLAGADATGTYYAAQSLRQLLPHRDSPGTRLAGTAVRDWPGTGWRGAIEGFYGVPWSHASRLDQLSFYGEHKMNIYVYSPKDDPYLRGRWREPYPEDELARIAELVETARAHHVEFTYALSPGLSVCYSSDADVQALNDKFQTLWDIGVRTFAVPLDDISYTDWNCAADEERFGTGGGAAGAAQAHLLNRVNREFVRTHDGAEPLQMVPTEYYDTTPSPYKKALAEQLDDDVLVEWTGVGVVAPVMTVAQARDAREVFGHPILAWDNYPVNDYAQQRLLLGPLGGREKGLPGELAGITANPMNQAAASKIALYTVADFAWNDAAYDPRTSWAGALAELAGGDRRTTAALRAFADASYGSALNPGQAPELSAAVAAYWDGGGADALDDVLRDLQAAPGVLRDRLPDRAFVEEAGPWLDATRDWGTATRTALRMVEAARDGDGDRAWRLRQRLPELVDRAKSHVYTGLGGREVPVVVGEGVLDAFVADAAAAHDRSLGLPARPKGATDLGTYQGNTVDRMTDGDDSTFFWSDGAPGAGSWVSVDLHGEREIGAVTLAMAKPGSPDDYVREGVLEYSADGETWTELAAFSGTPDVEAAAPAGTQARYVRARSTAEQDNWLVVREFTVAGGGATTTAGGPPAAEGSSLAAAADGDTASVYRAARAPAAGEALEIRFAEPRAPGSLVVLRPQGAPEAGATVQVRNEPAGPWRTAGRLAGAYTELRVPGGAVAEVRLRWSGGGAVPQVADVGVTGG
ncbi:beta-N-acetylglucosaminidase domain-containing protein [Streptomyces sp. WMMC500]|uniref:beta-N-acetylglucosaminidase domain-containing protein n=1 Tax=Streptomyces sp. WMMC500 TaxID=3015154 RepID=UPI00248B4F42|nr:beta-N-acetylglucosaminidase domain-containing protein [Streptomyces sp. WMMC500]WBB62162.1 beta-N-acetylglucosaminidase domain-containing protein [Streptomyces sp. WMMC500]